MVQFSGGSVTIRGGILYFSRARAREGFGDISGILAVFGGGGCVSLSTKVRKLTISKIRVSVRTHLTFLLSFQHKWLEKSIRFQKKRPYREKRKTDGAVVMGGVQTMAIFH